MDWIQFMVFLISVGGLFLWSRAESRADYRNLEREMKDFHGRLCVLEERFINWLTREK